MLHDAQRRPMWTPPENQCRPQRVLIVDDNELLQTGLRAVLSKLSWVASCSVANCLDSALDAVRRHHPQIVILSTEVRGRSGLSLARTLHQQMPHIKVLLMSGEGRISATLGRENGAVGFFPKQLPADRIVMVVKHVAEGGHVFPKARVTDEDIHLSRREFDVLQHLVLGLTNPEIASRLNLSRHTVKQHTSNVYRKLGVRNRAQAASQAREMGLVA